jgi:zinc protease
MGVEIPPAPDVAALVEGYEGKQEVSRGETFDSSPDGIERRLQRTTLASGMTLALLPKQSRGGRVVGVVRLRYGDVKSAFGRDATAFLTSQMLLRGTRTRNRQQIQDELNRLKARVSVNRFLPSGPREPPPIETHHLRTEIGFETVDESLAPLLDLLTQVLREPSFPEDELEQLKRQETARAEAARLDPIGSVGSRFGDHLAPYSQGDPRRPGLIEEWIAALSSVTIDDVKRFHADYSGAKNAELALVGNLDAQAVEQQTAKLLGNWESKRPYARPEYPYQEIEPVRQTVHLPDQANAALIAGALVEAGDEQADYPALVLGVHILGGGWLNSRLAQRLRQREGLSYGVGASVFARYGTNSSRLGGIAICAPENLAKVEAAMKEEFERAVRDGFSEAEVADAKTAWIEQQAVMRADDAQLANILSANERDNRTMDWQADLERKVLALTSEDVNAAMRRHVKPAALSFFLAGDLEKAGIAKN